MTRHYPVATAPRRASLHWRNTVMTWDEICRWIRTPKVSHNKETGNYILAQLQETTKVHKGEPTPCTNTHRDNASVTHRSALVALDCDHTEPGFLERIARTLKGVQYAWHTTHSSSPDELKIRLLVAVDREMKPFEYSEVVRALTLRLGEENFDPGSGEPARYMFRPGVADLTNYDFDIQDGDELSVDQLVDEYQLLHDDADLDAPRVHHNKRDPLNLPDPIGAFNRVYEDLDDLIERYNLPYEPEGDRWRLAGSSSEAGMGAIKGTPNLWYSNHANDPAFQEACSAFDLVRIHLFGELDEGSRPNTPVNKRPSQEAMQVLAAKDPRVAEEIFKQIATDFGPIADDAPPQDTSWKKDLRISPRTSMMQNTIANWDLIREHDPIFKRLRLNQMTLNVEFTDGHLPWRQVTPDERAMERTDRTQFRLYLQRTYRIQEVSKADVDDWIDAVARHHRYHPVRDYLSPLVWDGQPRLEECLPGARSSRYNRWVIRLCLLAAVARAFQPGLPWDHALVLYGGEGVGKSRWIEAMARGFDGKLPSRIDSPDAKRMITRSWIVVADEGHAIKRAENEFFKELMTQKIDSFRLPYDRDPQDYKRMAVVWSTTNDSNFLRNEVGNRRFLVVDCEQKADFTKFTPDYVDQIWAEVMDLYRSGEAAQLWLNDAQEIEAARERLKYTEEDVVQGIVSDYVSRLVPKTWTTMHKNERQQWMADWAGGFATGTEPMTEVCAWEVLHMHPELASGRAADRLTINRVTTALKAIPEWVQIGLQDLGVGYGNQLTFVRRDSLL